MHFGGCLANNTASNKPVASRHTSKLTIASGFLSARFPHRDQCFISQVSFAIILGRLHLGHEQMWLESRRRFVLFHRYSIRSHIYRSKLKFAQTKGKKASEKMNPGVPIVTDRSPFLERRRLQIESWPSQSFWRT